MSEQLYHHGIKGQKWGVRRYQNRDGTLTEEGKRQLRKAAKEAQTKKASYTDLPKRHPFQRNRDFVQHFFDEYGNVQLSYLYGKNTAIARGKEWCDKNLHKYFRHPSAIKISYDL